ncbi:high affinity immunoglobulin gamma Fc receptor I-like [Mastacembelus armatus]|uniref:high affinity immunoglobulin gamma Fc receptor I-like n=1 Tax=Mastacembelus armatus TaxID=205130 RepID=UPI000E45AD1B|nr:high affinity immunoglobulin gamma Fc receptor I-like [Mastacembelus armatus]
MDRLISLLVLSTLPPVVVPRVFAETSFKAAVEIVEGDSRIFSGETVRLRCRIPDNWSASTYLWFLGSEQLGQSGQHLILWNTRVKDSGKFYCQGARSTVVGDIRTKRSLPVQIDVDGGWAILKVSPSPGLVGNTLTLTCRVRGNTPLHEVILYKDGVEVMRQNGLNPHFSVTNLTQEHEGMYSCRASWDVRRRTHSVISSATPVQVLEVLTQPILEIFTSEELTKGQKMKLICHLQYNAPAPAPPVEYYFYRNRIRLGTATSVNYDLVSWKPGQYSCKARVPKLGLLRWSEPKSFEQETVGSRVMMAPPLHPRDPVTSVSSPELSLPPVADPTAVLLTPRKSIASPTFALPVEVSTRYPDLSLMPSQPAPSTLLSTAQSPKQTVTPIQTDLLQKSDNMSGDSDNMESDDMESDDMESDDMSSNSPHTVLH